MTTAQQLHETLHETSPRATERRFDENDCEQFVEQVQAFRRRLNLLAKHLFCPSALDMSISLTAGAVPVSYRYAAQTDVLKWWGRFSAGRHKAQHCSFGEGETLRMTIMYPNVLFSSFKTRVEKLADEVFTWPPIIHWEDGK
jgi:hypothetical protein